MTNAVTVNGGEGTSAILPADVLEEMGIEDGTRLYVVRTEAGLLLTQMDPELRESLEAFEVISARYANVLRELAK